MLAVEIATAIIRWQQLVISIVSAAQSFVAESFGKLSWAC